MGASYPKPDGAKVTRHAPKFGWVDLPACWEGDAPRLPDWREWDARTLGWWAALWARPQAAMWQSDGSSLFVLAVLVEDLIAGGRADAARLAEMRQIEDRHGLNPKALLQLRWRVVDESAAPKVERPRAAEDRRKRLKVVA
jgi:hypothetical protein